MITQLFSNQSVGHTVTVDLDVWLEYFLRNKDEIPPDEKPGITIGYVREQLILLEAKLDRPIAAYYRRSSKGHVHLRLGFPDEITVFDAFLLRSCLFDDPTRQNLDQRRYAMWGSLHEMNKCFDAKVEKGDQVYRAGPWIPIEKGREDLVGDALADWEEYWERIGRTPHKDMNHRALVLSHWKILAPQEKEELIRELSRDIEDENVQKKLLIA
jgi:hypothetical protein